MKQGFLEKYNKFVTDKELEKIKDSIDFFGINISEKSDEVADFKAYCEVKSSEYKHNLLRFLENNNMMRYSSVVLTENSSSIRYEIGIQNRDNINMKKLGSWMEENISFYQKYKGIIEYFSGMKISEDNNYKNSALYFVGFTGENESIDVLKTHFITRKCKYAGISYRDYEYDDKYYLTYLNNSNIDEIKTLSDLVKDILDRSGGNLWMIGFDCDKKGNLKYKIYIKKPKSAYSSLISIFRKIGKEVLARKTQMVEEWNKQNRQYELEGFALGINEENMLSVNFYY